MNNKHNLIAVAVSLILSGCGGSSSSTPTNNALPTPAPTPAPTPTPTTGSSTQGVMLGQVSTPDSDATSHLVGMLATDSNSIFILDGIGSITMSLPSEDSSEINSTGTLFRTNSNTKEEISVSGSISDGEYNLEVSKGQDVIYTLVGNKDETVSNSQPVLEGYYELSMEGTANTAVIISNGKISGNDTDNCHYDGDISTISNNIYSVNLTVSDVTPYHCNYQGDYTGLATYLPQENALTGGDELVLAVHNDRYARVRPITRQSNEPEFVKLPPGVYQTDPVGADEGVSFGVSHDGTVIGFMYNNHFGGYFDATPKYMGKGYVIHDSNIRLYDRSAWVIVMGSFALSDSDWQRTFEQIQEASSDNSPSDGASTLIQVVEPLERTYQHDLNIIKRGDDNVQVQLSEIAGRYQPEGIDSINITISADGGISGVHHNCDITGQMTERSDTASQEFRVTMTRSNCQGANSYSLDGEYEGFALIPYFSETDHYEISLFFNGIAEEGPITNAMTISSQIKQ